MRDILVDERKPSIGIRNPEGVVELECVQSPCDCSANNGEALLAALFEQPLGVFAPGAVKEFPIRIAEVEEWRTVRVNQKSLVLRHLEVTVGEVPRRVTMGRPLRAGGLRQHHSVENRRAHKSSLTCHSMVLKCPYGKQYNGLTVGETPSPFCQSSPTCMSRACHRTSR